MEKMAGLNFVKRNYHIFEEDDVLCSERNSKTGNNACQNVQKFRSSVKLESFVNEAVEAVIDRFSDHFSSWNQFSIKSMKNIFEIFSFSRLLGVKEFQKFLDK